MNKKARGNFCRARLLIPGVLAIWAGGTLAGCKNSTSAAMMEREVGPPPATTVAWTRADALHADPLRSAVWQDAAWLSLVAPANTTRTTAPCRAALLVDAGHLYVAFVCERVSDLPGDPAPGASMKSGLAADRDAVSVFLDTSETQDGREMAEIAATPAGDAACTWFRSASPIQANADGSPDLTHPIYSIPDWKFKGLECVAGSGLDADKPVWTVVLAIPLENLPPPLQVLPAAGQKWKFNLMRTEAAGGQQLQANYSPVYVGEQPISPYRMAELDLGKP